MVKEEAVSSEKQQQQQLLIDLEFIKKKKKKIYNFYFIIGRKPRSCIVRSLDCRVFGWKLGHTARLDRAQWPGVVCVGVTDHEEVFF